MAVTYDAAVRVVRVLVRVFFRRVEVVGLEHVPAAGGGLIVAWHPNGLVDPGLILATFPRQVVFGARHGLFKVPGLAWLMRGVGAVPVYRAADAAAATAEARRASNRNSLERLAHAMRSGSFAALFPEGVSHDAPHLMELKTGAARLYYQARAPGDAPPPVILPVGLHYDDKRAFRSNALVEYHPALALPPERDAVPDDAESEQSGRERTRRLTDQIERELREAAHATESWELHHLMHRARKLVRAERARRVGADPGRPDMQERVLGFARVWAGYYARLQTHPDEVERLRARLALYDQTLRDLRLEDHELDLDPRLASPWLGLILLLQVATVYLVLPPVLLVGYLVNLPVALLLIAVSKLVSRADKDEATVKVLLGAIAFPLAWVAAGLGTARLHPLLHAAIPSVPDTPALAGALTALLAIAGGATALRYLRVARETARAVRVRLFRRWRKRSVERLRAERAALFDAVMLLGQGLALPGVVGEDGRIVPAGS